MPRGCRRCSRRCVVGSPRQAFLAGDVAAPFGRVEAGPPAPRRNRALGSVLLVAEVPAGCGVLVYFSAVIYTTVGYGDLVLPQEWRLVGAVEGLTGILMCGPSTGLFFAVVSKFSLPNHRTEQTDP